MLGYRFYDQRVLLFNRGSRLVGIDDVMRRKAVVTHLSVMPTPTLFWNTNLMTSQFIDSAVRSDRSAANVGTSIACVLLLCQPFPITVQCITLDICRTAQLVWLAANQCDRGVSEDKPLMF